MKQNKVKAKYLKLFEEYSAEAKENISLAYLIYELRIKKGLTQSELANKANTTERIISNIENAQYDTGFNLLNRIFNCLDVNILKVIRDYETGALAETHHEIVEINNNSLKFASAPKCFFAGKSEMVFAGKSEVVFAGKSEMVFTGKSEVVNEWVTMSR